MPPLSHPGPLAPALPQVSLELVDGWSAVPAGDALLRAIGRPAGGPPPTLTVRVRTEPLEAAVEDVVLAGIADGPGVVVDPSFAVAFGDRQWTGVNVSGPGGPESPPWVEVHLATAIDRRPVHQVVILTGRAAGAEIEDEYALLQRMMETVEVRSDGTEVA